MGRSAQPRVQALAQAQHQKEAIKSMTESLELVRCLLRVVCILVLTCTKAVSLSSKREALMYSRQAKDLRMLHIHSGLAQVFLHVQPHSETCCKKIVPSMVVGLPSCILRLHSSFSKVLTQGRTADCMYVSPPTFPAVHLSCGLPAWSVPGQLLQGDEHGQS